MSSVSTHESINEYIKFCTGLIMDIEHSSKNNDPIVQRFRLSFLALFKIITELCDCFDKHKNQLNILTTQLHEQTFKIKENSLSFKNDLSLLINNEIKKQLLDCFDVKPPQPSLVDSIMNVSKGIKFKEGRKKDKILKVFQLIKYKEPLIPIIFKAFTQPTNMFNFICNNKILYPLCLQTKKQYAKLLFQSSSTYSIKQNLNIICALVAVSVPVSIFIEIDYEKVFFLTLTKQPDIIPTMGIVFSLSSSQKIYTFNTLHSKFLLESIDVGTIFNKVTFGLKDQKFLLKIDGLGKVDTNKLNWIQEQNPITLNTHFNLLSKESKLTSICLVSFSNTLVSNKDSDEIIEKISCDDNINTSDNETYNDLVIGLLDEKHLIKDKFNQMGPPFNKESMQKRIFLLKQQTQVCCNTSLKIEKNEEMSQEFKSVNDNCLREQTKQELEQCYSDLALAKLIETKDILLKISTNLADSQYAKVLIHKRTKDIVEDEIPKIISEQTNLIFFMYFDNGNIMGLYFQKKIPCYKESTQIEVENDFNHAIININRKNNNELEIYKMKGMFRTICLFGSSNNNFIVELNDIGYLSKSGLWVEYANSKTKTSYKQLVDLSNITGCPSGKKIKVDEVMILKFINSPNEDDKMFIKCYDTNPLINNDQEQKKVDEIKVQENSIEESKNLENIVQEEIVKENDSVIEQTQLPINEITTETDFSLGDVIKNKEVLGTIGIDIFKTKYAKVLLNKQMNEIDSSEIQKCIKGYSYILIFLKFNYGNILGIFFQKSLSEFDVNSNITVIQDFGHCLFCVNPTSLTVKKYNCIDNQKKVCSFGGKGDTYVLNLHDFFLWNIDGTCDAICKSDYDKNYLDFNSFSHVIGYNPSVGLIVKEVMIINLYQNIFLGRESVLDLSNLQPFNKKKQQTTNLQKDRENDQQVLVTDRILSKEILGAVCSHLKSSQCYILFDSNTLPELTDKIFWESVCGNKKTLMIVELKDQTIFGWFLCGTIPLMESKDTLEVIKTKKDFFFYVSKNDTIKYYNTVDYDNFIMSYNKPNYNTYGTIFTFHGVFQLRNDHNLWIAKNHCLENKFKNCPSITEIVREENQRYIGVKRVFVCTLSGKTKDIKKVVVNKLLSFPKEVKKEKHDIPKNLKTMNECYQMNKINLLKLIQSKEIGNQLNSFVQNKGIKILFDSNTKNKIEPDEFWDCIIGKKQLIMIIQMETGQIFGWYLNETIPQRKQNKTIQVLNNSSQFFFVINEQLLITKYTSIPTHLPIITFENNGYDEFLQFYGVFNLKTYKYVCSRKQDQLPTKFKDIKPFSNISGVDGGNKKEFRQFVVFKLCDTEEQDVINRRSFKPFNELYKEVEKVDTNTDVKPFKEEDLQERMKQMEFDIDARIKKMKEELNKDKQTKITEEKIEKVSTLYNNDLSMKIFKENNKINVNYKIDPNDSILLCLCNERNLHEIDKLMNTNEFKRVFSWKKGEEVLRINPLYLQYPKVSIFIETVDKSIFGFCALYQEGSYTKGWFISLQNPQSMSPLSYEKKNPKNIFVIPSKACYGLFCVNNVLTISKTYLNISKDFKKEFNIPFELEFFMNLKNKTIIEHNAIQIYSWK
ncbi:hypothetical protein CL6EHI_013280 [Entamoeba histolytica]|nr:hypothetical protein CL6EHI_013280 [Entamoeba histolytica]